MADISKKRSGEPWMRMGVGIRKHDDDDGGFNPYEFNSGSFAVVVQDDCIFVASDTRHSSEMGINSRTMSKVFVLDSFLMVAAGFYADSYEVFTRLRYRIKLYESRNGRNISIQSAAHLLHNILYSKRFFPYYSFVALCGFGDGPFGVCIRPDWKLRICEVQCRGEFCPCATPDPGTRWS